MRSWIFTIFIFFPLLSNAQDSYRILDSSYFFENNKTFTISEVISNDSLFKPISHFSEIIKKRYHLNYWTRVQLTMNTTSDLAFKTVALWVDKIEMYQYDLTGRIYKQEAGLFLEKQSGGILSGPYLIFRIPCSAGKITFYMHHLRSEARPGPIIAGPYESVIKETNIFYSLSWFILTTLLIVFLLSLSLFVVSHDKLYLFYALHVFFVGLFSMMDFGIIMKIIGSRLNYLLYLNMYTISFVGSIFALMFYTRAFLHTKKNVPLADKLLLVLVAARLIMYVISNIPGRISWFLKLNSTYWDMPLVAFAFGIGIYSIVKKQRYAWIFSLSFFVLLLSVIVPHLWKTHIVQINLPYLSLVLLETLLFFMAMIYRIKVLNKEHENTLLQSINLKDTLITQMREFDELKDKVNRELELKVEERTQEIKRQNAQIEEMNLLLQQHNIELKEDVENLEKARIMQKSISFEEFKKLYPDDHACYAFLAELKWPGEYACKKCNHTRYSLHDTNERRKCSKCNYIESPTADTLFHNVKFPIHKAFYLLYLFSSGKHSSFDELSKTLNLRMATIWSFKQKVDGLISDNKSKRKSKNGWIHFIFPEKNQG